MAQGMIERAHVGRDPRAAVAVRLDFVRHLNDFMRHQDIQYTIGSACARVSVWGRTLITRCLEEGMVWSKLNPPLLRSPCVCHEQHDASQSSTKEETHPSLAEQLPHAQSYLESVVANGAARSSAQINK